jgi:KipI family sensor histidine kinase inhibitor
MTALDVVPYGDSALLATPVGGTAEQRWRIVHALADLVQAGRFPGTHDVVATYDSLLVAFDCALITHDEVRHRLHDLAAGAAPGSVGPGSRTFTVPVVYGGECGPDLAEIAVQLGLSAGEVVRLHTGAGWVVRFLGSPVGAPMMDGSPFPAPVSRCPRPRARVPAGSVAVSGRQAVIYPVCSPGGWRLIGRTPVRLPDLACRPGDVIRFEPA